MCGILAYLGTQPLQADHLALTSATHRGPDGFGIEHFQTQNNILSLGHRRLSIIDLSNSAAQPMCTADQQTWMTYNGEIYNYLELKQELESLGHRFQSTSDTEVLLASYRQWGADCLDRLNGMFAFVVWDQLNHTLFAARDRFGIKPLYYWNTPHGFGIASEIKQLAELPQFDARLNIETAYQFLQYADFSYNRETLWQGVLELEPGHCFQINLANWQPGANLSPTKWYDYQTALTSSPIAETEAVETFRNLLEDAVRLRLRADVPVGTALSGGVDSSAITCLIAHKIPQPQTLRTYSACYREGEGDERPFIQQVLDTIEVHSTKMMIDPNYVLDHMQSVTYMHDLPVVGRAIFPYYNLCEGIQQDNMKVVLQGQGADEIMAGYGEFHWAFLGESLLGFRGLRALREHYHYRKYNAGSLRSDTRRLARLVAPTLFPTPSTYQTSLLAPEVVNNLQHKQPFIVRLQNNLKNTHKARLTALRMLLHNVDRASMTHSLEVRVPFLDHRLAEFCLALPSTLKIRNGLRKYILRQAITDIVPENIRNRTDKMGFSSPESTWSKGPLQDMYRTYLDAMTDNPLIDAQSARSKYERFVQGEIPFDRALWRLISFQCWLSRFNIGY